MDFQLNYLNKNLYINNDGTDILTNLEAYIPNSSYKLSGT